MGVRISLERDHEIVQMSSTLIDMRGGTSVRGIPLISSVAIEESAFRGERYHGTMIERVRRKFIFISALFELTNPYPLDLEVCLSVMTTASSISP